MHRTLTGAARTWSPLLAALALAACGSSQTASTPAPAGTASNPAGSTTTAASGKNRAHATAPGSACAASGLALAYGGTQGATGHLEITLTLRNLSQSTCTLTGYPAARLIDGTGRTLAMRVRRGGGFFPDTLSPPRAVVIAPGGEAHFGISFVTNSEYAHSRVCRTAMMAMTAMSGLPGAPPRWLRVSLRSAPRISPCGDQLVVSPVHA